MDKEIRRVEIALANFDDAEELEGNIFYIPPGDAAAAPDLPQLTESPPHPSCVSDAANIHLDEELNEIKKRAYQEGFDAAVKKLSAFSDAAAQLSRLREDLFAKNLDEMVQLVMAISEQVIQVELLVRPEIILEIISSAIQSAIEAEEFHVKVHPDDLQLVTEHRPMLLARISTLKNISVESDETISRGGCVLESALGEVDATLQSKLAQMKDLLTESISRHDQRHRHKNQAS